MLTPAYRSDKIGFHSFRIFLLPMRLYNTSYFMIFRDAELLTVLASRGMSKKYTEKIGKVRMYIYRDLRWLTTCLHDLSKMM